MTLVILLIFACSCSYIAGKKGYSRGLWFFMGLVFGIFALGYVLLLQEKD